MLFSQTGVVLLNNGESISFAWDGLYPSLANAEEASVFLEIFFHILLSDAAAVGNGERDGLFHHFWRTVNGYALRIKILE